MLPDPTDIAQEQAARFVEDKIREQLEAASKQPKRLPEDPGYCDHCGEPTASPAHLFCSNKCERDDANRRYLMQQNALTKR